MSTLLYSLGRWATRARKLVLILWIAVLALFGAGALIFGQGANAPITIPGTESQAAIDSLGRTFPEVSGTSATIIVVAADGASVEDAPYVDIINEAATELEDVDKVLAVQTPFSEPVSGGLADDASAALMTVQVDGESASPPEVAVEAVQQVTDEIQDRLPAGAQASYGGDMFSASVPAISPTEGVGVIIAFVVLILTLGSLLAAGMPLLIAMLGVGVSIAGLFFITAFVDLTSTTPMLALMLGLAVGIDYTLFIVSRHQEQLRAGLSVDESIARATATSGSAVVFAGLTVVIALVGLSVAGIPFLTALGVAAAAAVAIAVLIAITLTPAVLAMAGLRILPKKQRAALAGGPDSTRVSDLAQGRDLVEGSGLAQGGDSATRVDHAQRTDPEHATVDPEIAAHPEHTRTRTKADRFFGAWVGLAVKRPVITILSVLVVLGAAAIPALDLRLALPNATALEADDPARVTYELTDEHYGDGYNGPLILTGSIITSEDPLGLMEDLADEVRAIPGVADVGLATPNQGADTGIIQLIPEEGPHSASTAELVDTLRGMHDQWLDEYGVSLAVTGFTAVAIDVSDLLMQALLPFGILVVGLSLILLAMVFRSVWVPIKATLGYLLSVGVAFGAVVAVFQWGWLGDLLNVHSTGPILSFMPIILMGVLFGLAMDYEVFLVSRIREEYVHGADAHSAIKRGFVGSAKVVTAAALIMFAVFAAFIPEGDASIKVIALGLAVGVFVDAFIVRMTLVPAVLALLGDRAWHMPAWLGRILPSFDVEGEGLAREIAHANWPADMPDAVIAADELVLPGDVSVPTVRVAAGDALLLDPRDERTIPLAQALSGRGAISSGTIKAAGLLLPERASSLRSRSAWAEPGSLRASLQDRPSIIVIDLRDAMGRSVSHELVASMKSALNAGVVEAQASGAGTGLTAVVIGDRDLAERILPDDTRLVRPGDIPQRSQRDAEHTDFVQGTTGTNFVQGTTGAGLVHGTAAVEGGAR